MSKINRKVGKEKRVDIDEEVNKLSNVGFTIKTNFTMRLANVVVVKKALNKWSMCVDLSDLNTDYPKNPYPLPDIDRLIDGFSGYHTLRFMGEYLGYNQINIYPINTSMTTFMSNHAN